MDIQHYLLELCYISVHTTCPALSVCQAVRMIQSVDNDLPKMIFVAY